MKIGLYNLEPKVVNTALMQVAMYHKSLGDEVEFYDKDKQYDKIYAFSLFNFTDKSGVTPDMICGGTGFDITSRLPPEIEACDYDWSMYPDCDYSIIWFSRGCVNNCPFCIVRKKEGYIRPVKPKNLNPNGTYVTVADNNFFANPNWRDAIQQLQAWGQPVHFEGIDVRKITIEQCQALNTLKHRKPLKIAWDNPRQDLRPYIKRMTEHVKAYKIVCYVLIGYWSTMEEDIFRVEELRKLKVDPYVMPYNKKERYQRMFARWVNAKRVWRNTKWEEYEPWIKYQEDQKNDKKM